MQHSEISALQTFLVILSHRLIQLPVYYKSKLYRYLDVSENINKRKKHKFSRKHDGIRLYSYQKL